MNFFLIYLKHIVSKQRIALVSFKNVSYMKNVPAKLLKRKQTQYRYFNSALQPVSHIIIAPVPLWSWNSLIRQAISKENYPKLSRTCGLLDTTLSSVISFLRIESLFERATALAQAWCKE